MVYYNMGVFILIYFISLLGFCLNYTRLIKILIMMEFVVVSMMIILFTGFYGFLGIYLLYFLILSVCEGIMGLLVLVIMYRFWGMDYYELIDYEVD